MPAPAPVTPRLAHPDRLYIDGAWVQPAAGGRLEVVSAHSEDVFAVVAEAGVADIDRAARAARRAFDDGAWSGLSPLERAEHVARIGEHLAARLPELARAWIDQIGALASVAPMVVGGGRFWFDYYAGLARTFAWDQPAPRFGGQGQAHVVREPAGVVAAIAPWNNPFGIMAGKVAPALVAGCTVVMKPAPETPIEAYILAEAAAAAGLPDGVLNLVCADRAASDALVRHPAIDKVSFTGSVAAGRIIGMACAERFARCTLELGGKSAAIVLEDADIPAAAAVLAQVITMSAGQVCATLSRVIAVGAVHDRLCEAVRAELSRITVGHPDDPAAGMGPLAMRRQRDRVADYVAIARAEGARLVLGGSPSAHMTKGWYFDPTLFVDVTPAMRIAREEVFGPVLAILRAADEAEAVRIANDSDFGLYGAVFCADPAHAYRIARQVRTGTMAHNGFHFDPSLPFGGFKHSGVGREGGEAGLLSFTETKAIIL
ncbi:aldehyde dehydrogenase [Novosphingobium piscinae]|uniref:Aldehyde dehydrogenase n=1 Tax=Novosphingobium piscinae TaxID=1507448 RepID=A0A7X1KNW6_9SPHN|nr:aldehyde dehydrogenase [Novosphingobium piscinae]MBC2667873.1 aldehyde dehydrogenase [Novosphingobium piscinae]